MTLVHLAPFQIVSRLRQTLALIRGVPDHQRSGIAHLISRLHPSNGKQRSNVQRDRWIVFHQQLHLSGPRREHLVTHRSRCRHHDTAIRVEIGQAMVARFVDDLLRHLPVVPACIRESTIILFAFQSHQHSLMQYTPVLA